MTTNKFNISIAEIQSIAEAEQSILNNNEINERKKQQYSIDILKLLFSLFHLIKILFISTEQTKDNLYIL